MAQEILLKRSSAVYATEAAAWAALDGVSFKKGMPVIACYTKTGTVHGDNAIGAIYAVGTADGVGKYQAFASYEDFYAVYTDLNTIKGYFNADGSAKNADKLDGNDSTYFATATALSDFITKFNSMFTLDGDFIRANLSFYSVGEVASGGKPDGDEGGSSGSGSVISYADNANVGGGLTLGTLTIDGVEFPIVMPSVAQLANEGLATKDYVEEAILDAKDTRVDTLIGTDTGKSVRDISKEAVADLLDGADASYDTLIEIANYLESHETDAAAMSNAIEALKKITKTFYNSGTVTEDSIKTYIDNAVTALKNGDVASALTAIQTLQAITITAGNGLTGGGTLAANRTLSVKANGDSIDVSSSGVKVNTVNNLTSDSTTQPLSAAQGKALQANITTLGAKKITAGDGLSGDITMSAGGAISVNVDGTSIVITSDKLGVSLIDGGTF